MASARLPAPLAGRDGWGLGLRQIAGSETVNGRMGHADVNSGDCRTATHGPGAPLARLDHSSDIPPVNGGMGHADVNSGRDAGGQPTLSELAAKERARPPVNGRMGHAHVNSGRAENRESVGNSVLHAGRDRRWPRKAGIGRARAATGWDPSARVRHEQPGSARVRREQPAPRWSRPSRFPRKRSPVHDHELVFGVALRESAPGSRSVAVGPCAKQPGPDRFPGTVIARRLRQARSGQPNRGPERTISSHGSEDFP